MCFNVALLLKAKDCDRVFVSNDPVNWVDPLGFGKVGVAVKIGKKAWNHIQKRHVTREVFKNKSKFSDPSKIKKNIHKTVRNPDNVTSQRNGRTLYEKDMGGSIGTNGERVQRVVLDKHGQVITSFPTHTLKVPGANLGTALFGGGPLALGIDLFNPLSDLQDLYNFFDLIGLGGSGGGCSDADGLNGP